jgi:hypothetical protein
MIEYILVDKKGLILQSGQCNQDAELPSGKVYKVSAPFGATHYINGKFKTIEDIKLVELKALEKRHSLLLDSDWTQLPDSPANKEQWAEYRQELRDITQQEGFPSKIDWPLAPNEE